MDMALKKRITAFCIKWGRRGAGQIMRDCGLSESMTNKLLSGNYNCQPDQFRMKLLEKALSKK